MFRRISPYSLTPFYFGRSRDEFLEDRMRFIWAGFEFRMELNSHIEIVFGVLDGLHETVVWGSADDLHAVFDELVTIFVIELVAVTVSF